MVLPQRCSRPVVTHRWGVLFDFLYIADKDSYFRGTLLPATPRREGRIFEYAGAYRPDSASNLEIIAGFRQQDIDVELGAITPIRVGISPGNLFDSDRGNRRKLRAVLLVGAV